MPRCLLNLLLAGALVACAPRPAATATMTPVRLPPTSSPRPRRPLTPPSVPTARQASITTSPPAQSEPLQTYYLESLRARSYSGGRITLEATLETNTAFTRYRIAYPSDDLRITGLMNVPAGDGPFSVIILNHPYYDLAVYTPGLGTQEAADYFARHGYLTLTPDYRLYGGSDNGPDPYRTGFAIDVVNLIASVASLPSARPDAIGLWGHSMGGGVAVEVLAINPPGLRAAVLYGAMSGDIADNYRLIVKTRGNDALGPDWSVAPDEDPAAYQKLSPINYLHYVTAPVQIHHGNQDAVVPPAWSLRLAQAFADAGKSAALYTYPEAGHWFQGNDWSLFLVRSLNFFDTYLAEP